MVLIKALGALALAASTLAADFSINTPAALIQCQPVQLTWTGGTSPYILDVIPGGQVSGSIIEEISASISASPYTWTVNLASELNITLRLTDSTGTITYSSPVVIQAGGSTSCLNASASTSGVATGSVTTTGSTEATSSTATETTSAAVSTSTTSVAATSAAASAASSAAASSAAASSAATTATTAAASTPVSSAAAASSAAATTSSTAGALATAVAGLPALAIGVIGGVAMLF